MRKVAVFVEGQTELIFVREMLLKIFLYQNVSIECYTLFNDRSFNTTEYKASSPNPTVYYQIINVGNDSRLLSALLNREKKLWNDGFDRIVAVRDMYSRNYRELATNHQISAFLNHQFVNGVQEQLKLRAEKPDQIFFHFAIMEVEAWFWGYKEIFPRLHADFTHEFITAHLGTSFLTMDPETALFHPAKDLEDMLCLRGIEYDKSKGSIYSLLSNAMEDDHQALVESSICSTYASFWKDLLAD